MVESLNDSVQQTGRHFGGNKLRPLREINPRRGVFFVHNFRLRPWTNPTHLVSKVEHSMRFHLLAKPSEPLLCSVHTPMFVVHPMNPLDPGGASELDKEHPQRLGR